jgi:hypothetical protein
MVSPQDQFPSLQNIIKNVGFMQSHGPLWPDAFRSVGRTKAVHIYTYISRTSTTYLPSMKALRVLDKRATLRAQTSKSVHPEVVKAKQSFVDVLRAEPGKLSVHDDTLQLAKV